MMKLVVLAGSAVRMATSGVETQRAAWNADGKLLYRPNHV